MLKSALSFVLLGFIVTACTARPIITQVPVTTGQNVSTPSTVVPAFSDTVYFEGDSAILSDEAKSTLRLQANALKLNSASIRIEGHAHETGTREYNLALGAQRASAVRNFLVSQGLAQARISVVTFGKERPAASCSSEECWAQNRRAVTVVG